MAMRNQTGLRRFWWGVLAAWFLAAAVAAHVGVFDAGSRDSVGVLLPVSLAVVLPVVVFAVWLRRSARFRDFALSLNPAVLTAVQTCRVWGVLFLILLARGRLPAAFAYPAGIGDVAIGITAPLVAYWYGRGRMKPRVFVLWQVAGLADLVIAVGTGVLCSPTVIGVLASDGASTRAMGVLPLSLIPTFAVPLLVMLHVICIRRGKTILR
jgi:hypothetical protein